MKTKVLVLPKARKTTEQKLKLWGLEPIKAKFVKLVLEKLA